MMKRFGTGLLLLVAVVLAVVYFGFGRAQPEAKLRTATVTRGDIEVLVSASGSLQPHDYVDVGAQVSGQLIELAVEVGATVEKGDFLAAIDAAVSQARVDAARASLAALRAQRKEREAMLKLARSQTARAERLLKQNANSAEKVEMLRAELVRAQAQLGMVDAQIVQTESNLRADEVSLEYARIEAPMGGTVVSIAARRGQTLNAKQMTPVLMRIADLRTMTVRAEVSEADIPLLKTGMLAHFGILGGQGRRWQGRLRKIEPTPKVENNVVLYNVLFDVDNGDGALMTQMTAQVFFAVDQASDALLVPLEAVRFDKDDEGAAVRVGQVRVQGDDGTVQERAVKTGINDRARVQILSGLQEGETLVLPAFGRSDSARAQQIGRHAAMRAGGMRR